MIERPLNQTTGVPTIPRPSPLNERSLAVALFVLLLGWSLAQTGFWQRDLVNAGGWPLAWRFFSAASRPDLSPQLLRITLEAMLITVAYAVCGTVLSLLIGGVGGLLSSETWWHVVAGAGQRSGWRTAAPWLAVRAVMAVPRAIHEVIWGLILINILGLDPLSAVLAIAIPFGAITAKVFAEILDETPTAVLRALQGSGAPPFAALCYSVLPQALPDLLAYSFYRFECAIRSAAVLGLIGAGGLGFQILLSLQSLRYEQVWTFLYALVLLSGLSDIWSTLLRGRLHVNSRIDSCRVVSRAGRQQVIAVGDPVLRASIGAVLLLIPWAFWYVQADFGRFLVPRTWQLLAGVIQEALPPRLDEALLRELGVRSAQTLSMSVLATTLAGVGGILLAFPAANTRWAGGIAADGGGSLRRLWARVVLVLARGLLLLLRSIPEPIWALIALFVLFPGILPGAVGLGLYTLGVLGRLMAEVVENLDERPLRALTAQGATGPQSFLYGVLPSVLPRFLAYILYRWEVCIRATAIVGIVGAGGLGRLLMEQLARFDYRGIVTTLICFILLTFLVDMASAALRRVIR